MRNVLLLAAVLAIIAVLFAFGVFSHDARSEANGSLTTIRARKETLVDSTVAIGVVKSQVGAEVKVGSRVSGVVEKLRVSVGDKVTKGDVLAQLDDAQWRTRVASLEAEAASAAAELEYARADLWRMEHVPAFSVSQVDNSRRNLRVREAGVGQVRARLEEARIQLGYTRITAPISGTVASVSTYEGETVAADFTAPTFVTILDQTRLEVQAFVDEHDIGKVHVGQPMSLRVDAFAGEELSGRVRTIYPKAQLVNNVVNYVVIIDIESRAGLVLRSARSAARSSSGSRPGTCRSRSAASSFRWPCLRESVWSSVPVRRSRRQCFNLRLPSPANDALQVHIAHVGRLFRKSLKERQKQHRTQALFQVS